MLWQKKKKRKKATKPKAVTLTAPQQPVEEIPQTTEPEKKEETPKQKKPSGKKSEKFLTPEKAFLEAFGRLTNRHRAWDAWRDFITMFACSLSNPLDKEHRDKREALYLEIIKKYNKQEQEVFPELAAQTVLALEENPEQDFLGSIFMSLNLGDEHNGQIFTPYHVCELMAEMTMDMRNPMRFWPTSTNPVGITSSMNGTHFATGSKVCRILSLLLVKRNNRQRKRDS